jgi:hypothetical protein
MNLPHDLKHYRPSEDAFQLIEPELAAWLLIVALILTAILEGL